MLGTETFPWMVHIIGSEERAFSDMTPKEIWELYLRRRLDNLIAPRSHLSSLGCPSSFNEGDNGPGL